MITAYAHQRAILEESITKRLWALFMEAGTGKTFVSVKTCEYWLLKGEADAVIVMCPKSMIGTWVKLELPKFSTIPFNAFDWTPTLTKARKQELLDKIKDTSKPFYLVANHDAFGSDLFRKVVNAILHHRRVGWIYDESTAIKNIKSDRTQYAIEAAENGVFKRILSGTPVVQTPLDLYAQVAFLDKRLLGFKSVYSMKTRYCEIRRRTFGNRSFDEIAGYRDLDDLQAKLLRFSSFAKLEDCVDMPEQVFKQVLIEMKPKQAALYQELKEKAIAYIEEHDFEVYAVNALAMIVKLHQIVVGQLKNETGYVSIENNRLQALEDIVKDHDGKVLVWSTYVNSTRDIQKQLKDNCIVILSEHTATKRQELIETWRKSKAKALVLNPQSAGHGLTLVEADLAIFYSNGYNLEHRLQALRRNYRIGQTKRTIVMDFITPGTVEEKIIASLTKKEDIAKQVTTKKALLDIIR